MQLDEERTMLKSVSRTLSKSTVIWAWAELSRNLCWTEIDEIMSQFFHPSLCPIIMKRSIADLCLAKKSLNCWPSAPNRNRRASRARNKFGAFMVSKDGKEFVKVNSWRFHLSNSTGLSNYKLYLDAQIEEDERYHLTFPEFMEYIFYIDGKICEKFFLYLYVVHKEDDLEFLTWHSILFIPSIT